MTRLTSLLTSAVLALSVAACFGGGGSDSQPQDDASSCSGDRRHGYQQWRYDRRWWGSRLRLDRCRPKSGHHPVPQSRRRATRLRPRRRRGAGRRLPVQRRHDLHRSGRRRAALDLPEHEQGQLSPGSQRHRRLGAQSRRRLISLDTQAGSRVIAWPGFVFGVR